MPVALALTIILLGTLLTARLLREKTVKAPPVVALFGLVVGCLVLTGYVYKRNADDAARRACEQRVASREDLRGQFTNFYDILSVGFEDNEFVRSLVEHAREDMDRPPEEGGYPPLDINGCTAPPFVAYPIAVTEGS